MDTKIPKIFNKKRKKSCYIIKHLSFYTLQKYFPFQTVGQIATVVLVLFHKKWQMYLVSGRNKS